MNNYTEFTPKFIDAAYINSLVDLVNECRHYGVEINEVRHFQNGFHVTFKGFPYADAICHDGSYGSPNYMLHMYGKEYPNDWSRTGKWETIGFPWDCEDVSVHDARELAFYLHSLTIGKMPWENEDFEEGE